MANVYLITGASSDVGTALIQRILQEGDTVIAQRPCARPIPARFIPTTWT